MADDKRTPIDGEDQVTARPKPSESPRCEECSHDTSKTQRIARFALTIGQLKEEPLINREQLKILDAIFKDLIAEYCAQARMTAQAKRTEDAVKASLRSGCAARCMLMALVCVLITTLWMLYSIYGAWYKYAR